MRFRGQQSLDPHLPVAKFISCAGHSVHFKADFVVFQTQHGTACRAVRPAFAGCSMSFKYMMKLLFRENLPGAEVAGQLCLSGSLGHSNNTYRVC